MLWVGDGSSPMSDEDFETLLAMKPGLCVYISGYQTFSSTQITQLEAASITCKTVDGFTSADDIEDTVNELATLLGDTSADGGTNAPEIAASYLDWCAVIEDDLSNISTSSEVVFIEDWDEAVETVITDQALGGSGEIGNETHTLGAGAAIIRVGSSFQPLSDCLDYANVIDYSAQPTGHVHGFYTWDLGTWTEPGGGLWTVNSGDLVYISPLATGEYVLNGKTVYYGFGHFTNASADVVEFYRYTNAGDQIKFNLSTGSVPYLGFENFITVITKSLEIKQSLESNWIWQTNDTTYYGYNSISGAFMGGTTIDLEGSDIETVYSTIVGDYNVYVNPTGLGDWVDGSAESILESVWIAWRVQGYYSESTVKTLIKDFYRQFYNGYELSDSELTAILAGPAS